MRPWEAFYRRLAAPIRVEHTVPPPDVVPLADLLAGEVVHLDDTAEAVEMEQAARLTHAARIVKRAMEAEAQKDRAFRSEALMNLCFDLQSTLRPSPPDAEELREQPLPRRVPSEPVIPGGAS